MNVKSKDSLQMTLLFILPSQHLPNQRFSRTILTTLNARVINGTWNTTSLNVTTLHNCILESVSSAKYLGIDISSDLSWDTHINRISKKPNNTLGFLRRNIKIQSESLKSSAYSSCSSSVRVLLYSLVSIHRFKYL